MLKPRLCRSCSQRAFVCSCDMLRIIDLAGEEIWRSMQWYGDPSARGLHLITCTCADCT